MYFIPLKQQLNTVFCIFLDHVSFLKLELFRDLIPHSNTITRLMFNI